MYIICGVIMNGYIKSYSFDISERSDIICAVIYPRTLYIM